MNLRASWTLGVTLGEQTCVSQNLLTECAFRQRGSVRIEEEVSQLDTRQNEKNVKLALAVKFTLYFEGERILYSQGSETVIQYQSLVSIETTAKRSCSHSPIISVAPLQSHEFRCCVVRRCHSAPFCTSCLAGLFFARHVATRCESDWCDFSFIRHSTSLIRVVLSVTENKAVRKVCDFHTVGCAIIWFARLTFPLAWKHVLSSVDVWL